MKPCCVISSHFAFSRNKGQSVQQWISRAKKRSPNDQSHRERDTKSRLIPFEIILITVANKLKATAPLMKGNVMSTGATATWLNMRNIWFARDTNTVLDCIEVVSKIHELSQNGAIVLISFQCRVRETWPTVTIEMFLWQDGESFKKNKNK